MILAGGLSTRLYPLTKQVPKPLVPVAGEPNAAHLVRYLHAAGFHDIAINVHYLPDAIIDALGDGSRFGVRLEYLHEDVLLGSAGAVKQMETYFGDEHFVVVGCDDLTDLPLAALLQFHRERNAIATIGLVERADVEQYGVVVTDPTGRVVAFQEKPPRGTERSKLVNTGIYAFSPEIFSQIPAATFYDFGKQVFPGLQRAGAAFYGYDARGAYWCDIGTPDEYRRASFDVVSGRFGIDGSHGRGIDPQARVAKSGSIRGDVWVGAHAELGEEVVVVGPSVIGDGVRVGRGARIERSILWSGAVVEDGACVRDSIVGIGYVVAAGVALVDEVVAND